MDRGSYRHLLPAASSSSSSSPSARQPYPNPPEKPKLAKKRSHITKVACNACREKKSACDGRRPSCQMCINRGSSCVYTSKDETETPTMALKRVNETLKQASDAQGELINYLRYMPEDIATEIFRKLRNASGLDPAYVLATIKNDMALPTDYLSEQSTTRAILPSIHSDRELELTAQHPHAYPAIDPVIEADLFRRNLLNAPTPTKGKRKMKLIDSDFIGDDLYSSAHSQQESVKSPMSPHSPMDYETSMENMGLVPDQFDQQLASLNISFWTTVAITDAAAAKVIAMYLRTDHPVLGLFDSELFVRDLVNGQFKYCSSFLVTALLAFASQSYASRDSSFFSKSYEFETDAEKFWQIEGKNDSLTSIAGLVLLSQSVGCHGQVRSTTKYLKALSEMAERLRLFGIEERLGIKDLAGLSQEEQSTTSFASWGAFNVLTMSSLFDLLIPTPLYPEIPIPGTPKTEEDQIYIPVPPTMGETFTCICSLWAIVSETMFLRRTTPNPSSIPPAIVYFRYTQLLELTDNLPPSMIRQEHNRPHVAIFHIWFHAAVLEIFRPYVAEKRQIDLSKWSNDIPIPQAIFAASVKQLKRLMLLYISRHKFAQSIFWHIVLLYVGNAVLNDLEKEDWRFYFVNCIRGYAHLFTSFLVSKGIAQSLLAMALKKGGITNQEAVQLMEELQQNDGHRRKLTDKTVGFVVDLDLAITDPKGATVERLAEQFEQITVFDAYTTGIVER